MPTLAEAKAQATTIAALLAEQATALRALDATIGGMGTQAQAVSAAAAAVKALADAAVVPGPGPVIKVRRTVVPVSKTTGGTQSEKFANAMQEAIEVGRPLLVDEHTAFKGGVLDDRYNGLVLAANPGATLYLDEQATAIDGAFWLNPAAGKRMEITLRGLHAHGNRGKIKTAVKQNFMILGNTSGGRATVVAEDCLVEQWGHAGFISWGDDCDIIGINTRAMHCGDTGFGTTRGRMHLTKCESGYCWIGINPSAGQSADLVDCISHHNVGFGLKISLRSGYENDRAAGAAFPARVRMTRMRIEDNEGGGIGSTSAAPGSLISGSVAFARNKGGALNVTDPNVNLDLTTVTSLNDGPAVLSDDNAAIHLSSIGFARFESLDIRGAMARGINGGWGRTLEVGRLSIDGCAGPGLRWVNAPLVIDERIAGNNGGADEMVNN